MKLERERDIQAFKGKTWLERIELRHRANELDHSIIWIRVVVFLFTFAPIVALSHWLGIQFFPHRPLTAFVVIYFALSYPAFMLLNALFIVPRIRRALEADVHPPA